MGSTRLAHPVSFLTARLMLKCYPYGEGLSRYVDNLYFPHGFKMESHQNNRNYWGDYDMISLRFSIINKTLYIRTLTIVQNSFSERQGEWTIKRFLDSNHAQLICGHMRIVDKFSLYKPHRDREYVIPELSTVDPIHRYTRRSFEETSTKSRIKISSCPICFTDYRIIKIHINRNRNPNPNMSMNMNMNAHAGVHVLSSSSPSRPLQRLWAVVIIRWDETGKVP